MNIDSISGIGVAIICAKSIDIVLTYISKLILVLVLTIIFSSINNPVECLHRLIETYYV